MLTSNHEWCIQNINKLIEKEDIFHLADIQTHSQDIFTNPCPVSLFPKKKRSEIEKDRIT